MRKDFILRAFECDDGSIFPLEGFCFANQCSDILDEFDAQDLDLDEVGVCDWSYSVLCSQCKWRGTDIIVSSPECLLISYTIVLSLFFSFLLYEKVCSSSKF